MGTHPQQPKILVAEGVSKNRAKQIFLIRTFWVLGGFKIKTYRLDFFVSVVLV